MERVLRVQCCVETDTFRFRIVLQDKPLTRRGILSTVCSVSDPLGFAAPLLLSERKFSKHFAEMRLIGTIQFLPLCDANGKNGGMSYISWIS